MRRLDLANAPEVLLGLIEIADVLPQHHRDLHENADVLIAAPRLERRLIRRDEREPVLRAHQLIGQRAQRLRLARIEMEHAFDREIRARRVRKLVARDIGKRDQRRDFLVVRGADFAALLEQQRQIEPALRLLQQPREVKRRLRIAIVDLERLAKIALGFFRLRREPHVRLGGRNVQPRRQRAIRRRLRFLQEFLGELFPILRSDIELADRLFRHRVVATQREHLLERSARAGGVEQLAVERDALLQQQIHLAIDIPRCSELEIEQGDDTIGPSARGKYLARCSELRGPNVGWSLTSHFRQRPRCLGVVGVVLENG